MRVPYLVALLVACGDNFTTQPFDGVPQTGDFTNAQLSSPVHVVRDTFGIAHISGANIADVAFVQGYVTAHDRLPQMDILRRFGAGTLAELFGALDSSVIDTDLEMRVHRMKPLAQETWDTLQASTDPDDRQIVQLLQRYSDGVNAYAADLVAKQHGFRLDPEVEISFDPTRFAAWSPVDSLVLGRFQAFALCWTTPVELDLTELYQKLRATYDQATSANPAAFARRGITRDIMKIRPVGLVSTIDGFPNVDVDSGTRSDGGRPGFAKVGPRASDLRPEWLHLSARSPKSEVRSPTRPSISQELLDRAHDFFARDRHDGPFGALGPHAFMYPFAGSNNWAVSPQLAGGVALLATDQHLQLPNPSIFYPIHLVSADGMDALGVTFPGIPGIILGTNGDLAWSATVSYHDVNDVYLENIAPCAAGGGDCVAFQNGQVPIQTFTEQVNIGALGTVTDSITATYEFVPHHGPFIPTVANHQLVPRSSAQALSVRFTGYDPTFEIRAIWNLVHAKTVDSGFRAFKDFAYGSENWTMIDSSGSIAWTQHAYVPARDPRAYTWDAATNPDGLAPFLVLPGDGTAEWQDRMSSRYVPHAIDPPKGYLATANADPVGQTFDDAPLSGPIVDGRPLYSGVTYAAGVREERISRSIEAAAAQGAVTVDDMARIQHDASSTVGRHLAPPVIAALGTVADSTGAPSDVAPYLAALPAADTARLQTALALLSRWTYATPTALDAPSPQELVDSAATAAFNTFMHFFIQRAIGDELAAVNFDVWRLDDNFTVRTINAILTEPSTLVQSAQTGQPILCDDIATAGPDDSCTKMILVAMVDAMTALETASPGFGTADPTQWRWGSKHTLTITPLFPNTALNVPAPGELPTGGFPKAGDNLVVNRADMGWSSLSFSQFADGPAQRFLAIAAPGRKIAVKWQLPGGTIYDSRDPHYRDLMDNYYIPQHHFDAPFSVDEIVAAGESRWEFHR
jgi:penicillin amidase